MTEPSKPTRDLLWRLRNLVAADGHPQMLCELAADEIERLRLSLSEGSDDALLAAIRMLKVRLAEKEAYAVLQFRAGLLAALKVVEENREAAQREADRQHEDGEEELADQTDAAVHMADVCAVEISEIPGFDEPAESSHEIGQHDDPLGPLTTEELGEPDKLPQRGHAVVPQLGPIWMPSAPLIEKLANLRERVDAIEPADHAGDDDLERIVADFRAIEAELRECHSQGQSEADHG